jgi:N6-adenosine-specific RNA methylase IME4/ParB-like chromosome segregation protein Spo0J
MKFHRIANIFPMMSEPELQELRDDVQRNGLLQPIWIYEGQVLDGRNRYRVCQDLQLEPKTKAYDGTAPIDFVISMNLHRRHLTASQKSAIAVAALPLFEAEAKKRQATSSGGKDPQLRAQMPQAERGKSSEQVAKAFGVSPRYIREAKSLHDTSPKAFASVLSGEKTLTAARREKQREEATRAALPLPTEKFRILYADPPWKYGDQLTEDYGPTRFHYPAMSITELCMLPIADLAEENAVLFLWVTSPLLPECFTVIKAWGFTYKASFVWDKIKHNMGHYNSVRHEFLLICTRGSCLPDSSALIDSVQSVERTEHSRKPEEFRAIIDQMYIRGRKLELFARWDEAPAGWDRWGNES